MEDLSTELAELLDRSSLGPAGLSWSSHSESHMLLVTFAADTESLKIPRSSILPLVYLHSL